MIVEIYRKTTWIIWNGGIPFDVNIKTDECDVSKRVDI